MFLFVTLIPLVNACLLLTSTFATRSQLAVFVIASMATALALVISSGLNIISGITGVSTLGA